jgi:formylglycine-generating enzyme required for sulfatase activity
MKTSRWMMVAVATGLMCVSSAWAGDLDPTNAPGPTMHSLEEIYQRQATLEANQVAIEARLQAAGMAEVPDGMTLIPTGDFVMGDAFDPEGGSNELPVHTNTISAFYMDETEVTKA